MAEISRYHRVYKLPTGETLVYFKHNKNNTTEYYAGFYCGSALDEIPGTCHYLEHILHKESPDLPNEERTKFLAEAGVYTNAFTTQEYVAFYTNSPNSFLDEAMEQDSKLLFNKTFSNETIDNERPAIAQEIKMNAEDGLPFILLMNNRISNILLNSDLLGTEEDIQKIDNQVLVKYADENFVSENMFMVVKSNLEFEEIKEKFEKHFVNKVKSDPKKRVYINNHRFFAPKNFMQVQVDNNQKTVVIDIAYRATTSSRTTDLFAFVQDYIFNNSFHGRLLKKLRTENGLVYTASYVPCELIGGLNIEKFEILTSKEKVNRALEVFGEMITDIGKNGITQEELDNLKNNILIAEQDRATGLKDTDLHRLWTIDINNDELFYNNQLHKVKDLTLEQVNAYLKKVYDQKEIFMLMLGDIDQETLYQEQDILKMFNAHQTRFVRYIDQASVFDTVTNKIYKSEDFKKFLETIPKDQASKIVTDSYLVDKTDKFKNIKPEEMTMEDKLALLEETAQSLGLTLGFTMSGSGDKKQDKEEKLEDEEVAEDADQTAKDDLQK